MIWGGASVGNRGAFGRAESEFSEVLWNFMFLLNLHSTL